MNDAAVATGAAVPLQHSACDVQSRESISVAAVGTQGTSESSMRDSSHSDSSCEPLSAVAVQTALPDEVRSALPLQHLCSLGPDVYSNPGVPQAPFEPSTWQTQTQPRKNQFWIYHKASGTGG